MKELGKENEFLFSQVLNVSKVWEDNTITQHLANIKGKLMTSHTKYIGIKYHLFCSIIKSEEIDIMRIDIKE